MNFIQKVLLFFMVYDLCVIASNSKDWWKYTTMYQIYISSFKDSNGDGIGDINGVTSMLDHFVDLGIETIWLTPYFKSPMLDMGYDVSNFVEIDPRFGTMEDFDKLIRQTEKKGLKLLIDFVINHSSDQHPWFNKSMNKIEPYTDYYVWVDAANYDKDGAPISPNNWVSLFEGSAWTWNENRKQFYLHQFADTQPDLNLRNEHLKKELKQMIKFWFDKGVAGARLDATKHFIEDKLLRDEPILKPDVPISQLQYRDYKHKYTTDLWETYEFIHELREFVDNSYSTRNNQKILIAEAYTDLNHTMMYYGNETYPIVQFPFNFFLVMFMTTFRSPEFYDSLIKTWLKNMPAGGVANWVAENHDNRRIGNRINEEYMDIILVTIMTLPGVACIYYGQEIGMMDNPVRPDQARDPNSDDSPSHQSRDPERLPMQWDDSMNAGFTSKVKPWLPVNTNYWRVNVESQKQDKHSRYHLYKTLSKLRTTKTLKFGGFRSYIVAPWVYAFARYFKREPMYISVFNMGTETEIVHLHHSIPNLPAFMTVEAASINSGYEIGDKIRTNPKFPSTFIMRPLSAIVISTK